LARSGADLGRARGAKRGTQASVMLMPMLGDVSDAETGAIAQRRR